MYRFQSVGEFRALLSLYNISLEEVKGEANGRAYHGIVYSALDGNGEKTGTPIKSSTLGKMTGSAELEKLMRQSGTVIKDKNLKTRTHKIVASQLKAATSEADFRKALQDEGIDLVLRRNDTGRIYGVTFIDHRNRVVLNGSRLGKEFSANVFNERFPFMEEQKSIPPPKSAVPISDNETDSKEYSTASGGLLSLLTPEPEQPEREPSLPKKRKKKRRRYGRQD